jgi:hypothetical protein
MAIGGVLIIPYSTFSTLFSIFYLYLYIPFIQEKTVAINLYSADVNSMH